MDRKTRIILSLFSHYLTTFSDPQLQTLGLPCAGRPNWGRTCGTWVSDAVVEPRYPAGAGLCDHAAQLPLNYGAVLLRAGSPEHAHRHGEGQAHAEPGAKREGGAISGWLIGFRISSAGHASWEPGQQPRPWPAWQPGPSWPGQPSPGGSDEHGSCPARCA